MNFYIYYRQFHPKTNPLGRTVYEQKGGSFEMVKKEYKRLQGIYPGCRMCLVVENDYNERSTIHSGYWL